MKALRSTWDTLTHTLSVVSRYGSYSVYPLLSTIVMLLVIFTAIIPSFERVLGAEQSSLLGRLAFFLIVYIAYGVLYFVSTFCNVALLTVIAARLDGADPGLSTGFVRASERIGLIGLHTLVSATLGLLSFLARVLVSPLFGMVIAPMIGKRLWTRWQHLSYTVPLLMAVPVIALDQPAPARAFKRSDQLVKQTWGERVQPAHSIGILALLVLLPIIMLIATPILQQGRAEHNPGLLYLGLSVMLIAIGAYTQLNALVQAIFGLAAYRYATARKHDVIPGDASYAEHAFVKSTTEPTQDNAVKAATGR